MSCEIAGPSDMGMGLLAVAAVQSGVAITAVASVAATALAVTGGIAAGGYLAYKGAQGIVILNEVASMKIEDNKRKAEQKRILLLNSALSNREEMLKLCNETLKKVRTGVMDGILDKEEAEDIVRKLNKLIDSDPGNDIDHINQINYYAVNEIRDVANLYKYKANLRAAKDAFIQDKEFAKNMDRMKKDLWAVKLMNGTGQDAAVPPVEVTERLKLKKELVDVCTRIKSAVSYVNEISNKYGLLDELDAFYSSCFNGIDAKIGKMFSAEVSNDELRDGIEEFKRIIDLYEDSFEVNERTINDKVFLYDTYKTTAAALLEDYHNIKYFKTNQSIEMEICNLNKRRERLEKCASIYRKLGPIRYQRYAWEQELVKLGYSVCSNIDVADLAGTEISPKDKINDEEKEVILSYQWGEAKEMVLYSFSHDKKTKGYLQVVTDESGNISMSAIAPDDVDENDIRTNQVEHCEHMKQLKENLKKNWFIASDIKEVKDANEIIRKSQFMQSIPTESKKRKSNNQTQNQNNNMQNNRVRYIDNKDN